MVEVNLKELAGKVGVSLPTMTTWVDKWPDFPVVQRGSLSKSWKFDAEKVVEFLRIQREAEAASEAERDELLAQLELPIARKDAEFGLSIKDKISAAKLRMMQIEEQKISRFLVPTLEVRITLEKALRRYAAMEESAVERVVKKHNLPEAVRRALQTEFAEARTAFVRDAGEFLTETQDEQFALRA